MNLAAIDVNDPLGSLTGDVEIRSSVAAPQIIPRAQVAALARGQQIPGADNRALRFIKPTITLNSPVLGRTVIAPYGEAGPNEYQGTRAWIVAGALGLVGVGFVAGLLAGRR